MSFKEFFSTKSWWGKIFGLIFGYLAAGPTGAILGLLIGNFFDRGLVSHYTNPFWYYHNEKNPIAQHMFFQAAFSVMGYVAKSDGRVSEQELDVARSYIRAMNLNQKQKSQAMRLFTDGKNPMFNLKKTLNLFYKICGNNYDLLRLFIDIQYQIAQTDGLTTKKIQVLDLIFTQLGFSPFHQQYRFYEDFGTTKNYTQKEKTQSSSQEYSSYSRYNYKPNQSNLDQAYALMNLPSNASKQEVKRAYRKLLSVNHPDKLIAQGKSQEMIKAANEKTQKIVKAYDLICENKGW